MMLKRHSFVPLYVQMAEGISQRIASGELSPGDQLPSERELAEAHNVSRLTARQALEELVLQGRAYRVRGRGTFVAEPKIREVSGLRSFSDDMRSQGLVPSSRVLRLEVIQPEEALRARLKLGAHDPAVWLERLRLANNLPVAFESVVLPHKLCPGLENEDMATQSLYALLRDKYGIYLAWGESEIEARGALPHEAALFEFDVGQPLMVATRMTFTESFEPVEFAKSIYRGDRFTFYVGRQRIPPLTTDERR
ncbi:MAG: GntR family transcriptional regulator [Chloroflexi bacterium]|nr:GntR family transcriptional regulator [Chloroflexota bacterium]